MIFSFLLTLLLALGSVPANATVGGCCQMMDGQQPFCAPASSPEGCQGEYVAGATCNPDLGTCQGTQPRCGDGVVEGEEQCDDDSQCCKNCRYDVGATCNDGDLCTTGEVCGDKGECSGAPVVCTASDQCHDVGVCNPNTGACSNPPKQNGTTCNDGQYCTVSDVCQAGACTSLEPRACAASACQIGTCNEGTDTCDYAPDNSQNGESCGESSYCTDGGTCDNGTCAGGTPVVCDDSNSCTTDTCDEEALGCVYDTTVESIACGSCSDGLDNDDDGDTDSESCECALMCEQQHFGLVVNEAVPKRYRLYTGSDVLVLSATGSDPNLPAPYPLGNSRGSVCTTSAEIRAGASFGDLVVTGNTKWGVGETVYRITQVRGRFLSAGGINLLKATPPYVGEGQCSTDSSVCNTDANCLPGTCEGRLDIDDVGNTFVDTTGTDPEYLQCVAAMSTMASEDALLDGLAGNVAGLDDGTVRLRTNASNPALAITVGGGQQVIDVRSVAISGGTTMTITGQADTVLIIKVQRSLRFGGEATLVLAGGLSANNVLWHMVGTSGSVKIQRDATFAGTLLAADRKRVRLGGEVNFTGAIKAKRVHVGGGTVITQVPFTPYVTP